MRLNGVGAGSLLCLTLLGALPMGARAQARTHVVIVVGIGGTDQFRKSFHAEASQIYTALVDHGIPKEDITYLGERVDVAPEMISDQSTRANILKVLGEIAQKAGPSDRVLVVLIGHGVDAGEEPEFNVPGPDLTPTDFELAAVAFPTQSLALVLTGSSSGGWVKPLAGPNRIVVAATRSSREQNATQFGEFFAKAVAGEGADLDHDQKVSLLEAFTYAREEVQRYYEENNALLTEHAVLDDNGDGDGSTDAGPQGPDGLLAATFTLGETAAATAQAAGDEELARLYTERDQIQARIDSLRTVRDALSEDDYLQKMEPLLVELGLKNREIKEHGGDN